MSDLNLIRVPLLAILYEKKIKVEVRKEASPSIFALRSSLDTDLLVRAVKTSRRSGKI